MRRILLVLVLLGLVGAAAFWFITRPQVIAASELPAHKPNLENGKVMFFAGGCIACHATPKAEDRTRLGGGMELKSPYGSFYPPNISPHPKDGIGSWNEAQFVTAMVKGTSPDGRHYFPSFPYASYQTHDARRPARHVRLHQDAAAGRGPRARPRHPLSVQHPPRARRLEVPLSRRRRASRPIRTSRRNGIAAPIW